MNILVIGKAKTGTTIVSKTIQNSLPGAAYFLEPKDISFFEDTERANRKNDKVVKIIFEHWSQTPHRRNAIVHGKTKLKFDRMVAILRDPRDELISKFYYAPFGHITKNGLDNEVFGKWLSFMKEKERAPGKISFKEMILRLNELFSLNFSFENFNVRHYSVFLKKNRQYLHILRYEDFIDGRLGPLEDYLGFKLIRLEDLGRLERTNRSGGYNNWKKILTPADVAELKALFGTVMDKMGYSDWELDDSPVIESKYGSDYLERLAREAAEFASTRNKASGDASAKKGPAEDASEGEGVSGDKVASCFPAGHPLHNDGVVIINAPGERAEEKTVIVLGAPRGGTSMVAGSLRHLGIFMGGNKNDVTYEDSGLIDAVDKNDMSRIRDVVARRNAKHKIWGWKQPKSFDYFFEHVAPVLRNPHFVIVFRDVLAVAKRNSISAMADAVQSMRATLRLYLSLADWLETTKFPCLLVSYEKALGDKVNFAASLGAFVGIDEPALIQAAVDFIQPSPDYYLDSARITDSVGLIEVMTPEVISGWAMFRKKPGITAEVLLESNGEALMSVKADRFRQDLLDEGIHPTGNCGFAFELSEKMRLGPQDNILVRVVGDIKELQKGKGVSFR